VVPLTWFPGAAAHQQVQIAVVVSGMMGAGAFMLNPLPRASMAYLAIYCIGAVGGLLLEGNPAHAGIAFMLAFYAGVLAFGALAAGRRHAALVRSQAEMAEQQRSLALLLRDFEQHADEALWQTDAQGRVSHASPRLCALLGLQRDTAVGQPLLALLRSPEGHLPEVLRQAMEQGLPQARRLRDVPLEVNVRGQLRHLVLHGKRFTGDDGQPQGWRGVLADVTERVSSQQRLHQMAHSDPLTGLANRLTLREALDTHLVQGKRGALLSLDLDDFKGVNDTLGHTAGDQLLSSVAQRLRDCLRPGDLVARLGGDEFAVLMQHGSRTEDAEALAERLIGAISQPFDLQGRHLRIGGSVGVAMFGGSGSAAAEEIFVRADMALYAAKAAGRGRHVVYLPALGERRRRRQAIEQGLRHAVERGELSLHWQPKVDIASWAIVGAEALLRWKSPVLGAVAPAEFIEVAEECGLIDELGRFALGRACAEAAGPLAPLMVSVNVSPVQLHDPGFVDIVRTALRTSGLPASRLELEITETLFLDDATGVLQRLHALHDLGVRVALDDFGTGYSSLAYLRRFPFDTLKIDRAFVNEAMAQRDARAIVQSIAGLAAKLGMRTVCEGVETAPQLAAVSEAGCDQMQGYLASPPQPLAQFGELLRQWRAERPATVSLH
jgi:diguanylate cyclase (GGDEF)-like protein/PAS domain S-box-containing protein